MVISIGSSVCECLELASQGTVDQMINRIARASRDRIPLNASLQVASQTIGTELSDLQSTLTNVLDFDSSLTERANQGFSFPPEGGISLGEVSRCLNVQINMGLTGVLGNFNPLAKAFCALNKSTNLIVDLVDEVNPRLDAMLSFGCNSNTVAGLQTTVSNTLGSIGADQAGRVDISNLTSESLVTVGQDYLDGFNEIVRCCLNVEGIKDTIKSFITDPFSGNAFNAISFSNSLDDLI